MSQVLIVDDEAELASLVEFNVRQAGFEAVCAGTGEAALEQINKAIPDLVILDVMLPDMSGQEVCRRLRLDPRTRELPVIMLTARGEEHDRVAGFEAGADDYVTKPFSPRELVWRVKAMLRRSGPLETPSATVSHGPIKLDLGAHKAFIAGAEVALTSLEFRLLHHFLQHPGKVRSREQLLAEVWEITSPQETRTVDTHVMRLRDRLGVASELVETVRGVGYRLALVREAGRPG